MGCSNKEPQTLRLMSHKYIIINVGGCRSQSWGRGTLRGVSQHKLPAGGKLHRGYLCSKTFLPREEGSGDSSLSLIFQFWLITKTGIAILHASKVREAAPGDL